MFFQVGSRNFDGALSCSVKLVVFVQVRICNSTFFFCPGIMQCRGCCSNCGSIYRAIVFNLHRIFARSDCNTLCEKRSEATYIMAFRSKCRLSHIDLECYRTHITFICQILFSVCLAFTDSNAIRNLFPLSCAVQEAESKHIFGAISSSRTAPNIGTGSYLKPQICALIKTIFCECHIHGFTHPVDAGFETACESGTVFRRLPKESITSNYRISFSGFLSESGGREHRQRHGEHQKHRQKFLFH